MKAATHSVLQRLFAWLRRRSLVPPRTDGIRVLFIVRDPLPPFRSDITALFGKYLPRKRIFSDIVGQRARPDSTPLTWPAGAAIAAGRFRQGLVGQLTVPLKDAWALCRYRAPFDVLQVRDKIRSAICGWAVARWRGKPFVYWMSFPYAEGFLITARNRERPGLLLRAADFLRVFFSHHLLYGFVLKRADHVFVQSEAMRGWLCGKGIDCARMTAVPMGVDPDLFRRERIAPAEHPRLRGRRPLLYLGLLEKPRRSTFLLDLLAAIREQEPSALLILAGDAPSDEERRWIRGEIAARSLQDDVLLTGWLSQGEAMRYLVRSEVGLSPIPRGELFDVSSPTKLLEYLALGIPAVANDIPDQALVMQRSGAGLCVPMEVDAFRDAVLRLLRDDRLRGQCSARGPKYIKAERSYEVLSGLVARTYESLVSTPTVAREGEVLPPFSER